MASKYEDTAVVEMVSTCLKAAVTKRQEECRIPSPFPKQVGSYIDDPWPVYEEFVNGDPWKRMGKMAGWKSLPNNNFGFIVVEANTTKLTDNRPKVEFLPQSPDDTEKARVTNAGFNKWWDESNGMAIDALAVKDSRKFCVGWLHLRYDRARKKQVLEAIHPESIYLDPDTTADSYYSDEPNYLIYEYVAAVADIIEAYPKVDIDDLRPDWLADSSFTERIRSFFTASKVVKNPAMTIPVYELWIRDPSTVTWEKEFGENIVKMRGLKYPGGRVIKVAGGVVLSDEANPYKHGEFPFSPIHCYPQTGKFYGSSDMKNLLPALVMCNKYDQLIQDTTLKSGGGMLFVNTRYGLHTDDIVNEPMAVYEVTDVDKAARFQQFPSPARHMVDHKDTLKADMQDMAGLHDSSMGRYTPGNKTAVEVSTLSESDNTRVRLAAKFHSLALTRIGRQWLSNAKQYGDFKWIVRVAGDDGSESTETFSGKDIKNIDFDLSVGDFAMLPDTYQERKAQAANLFAAGVIDPEEYLKTLEWPNYKAVLARIKKEQEAALAAQQQATPPPAPVAQEVPQPAMDGASSMPTGPPPPEILAMLQGQQAAPEMGAVPFDEPDIPDDSDPMELVMAIAEQSGRSPEEVIQMLAEQGVPMT
jgi:hypothetical protein